MSIFMPRAVEAAAFAERPPSMKPPGTAPMPEPAVAARHSNRMPEAGPTGLRSAGGSPKEGLLYDLSKSQAPAEDSLPTLTLISTRARRPNSAGPITGCRASCPN
ncbi:hypothetical protein [Streptomyces sp. NPDC002994]|uniref:hypothetical protein n=1 Tax=Streptomyces sp. NPDC002994 TaxID=3154441 RepID=UPI00339E88D6